MNRAMYSTVLKKVLLSLIIIETFSLSLFLLAQHILSPFCSNLCILEITNKKEFIVLVWVV